MDEQVRIKLIQAALAVQQRAYAPYSQFRVGAAILDGNSEIHTGCNVENASYGLSLCAERSAVSRMVACGQRVLTAIAVASRGGVTPCGACRQVLHEFGSDIEVLLVDEAQPEQFASWRLGDLLPGGFRLASSPEQP